MREEIDGCFSEVDILRFRDGRATPESVAVCREEGYRLYLNDTPLVAMVASPCQLRELGAGFVISEGLARSVRDVVVQGDEIRVYGEAGGPPTRAVMESSGGPVMAVPPVPVVSSLSITPEDILRVMPAIVSALWQKTGGAHCAVLFAGGTLQAKASDVGRHNTVDKVVGAAILGRIDPSGCILGCTGRQPAGMVAKVARAGIPVIVSKAATTQAGIEMAAKSGVTLICRVKEGEFSVYTHPHRVVGVRPG